MLYERGYGGCQPGLRAAGTAYAVTLEGAEAESPSALANLSPAAVARGAPVTVCPHCRGYLGLAVTGIAMLDCTCDTTP